jgi:HSP20 family protein
MAQFPFQIRQLPGALQEFASEMENIVDQVLNSGCSTGASGEKTEVVDTPALDVYEDETGYDLFLDVPGASIENIKIELVQDKLHVSGVKGLNAMKEGATMHRCERPIGRFARMVRLPKQVDADRIEAILKHGVLQVRLPKVPKPSTRQIEIRSAE